MLLLSPMPILTCCMELRSRTVTAWSLSESKLTGDITHPPIVGSQTFAQAQQAVAGRRRTPEPASECEPAMPTA